MLRLISFAAQAVLIAFAGYNAVTALWGWRDSKPAPAGARARRLRVVVPAHDEAAVLPALLDDLSSARYERDLVDIWVLADRCRDSTARVASELGARVAERHDGPSGKGAALSWYLSAHPLDDDESLVVLDADNRLPPDALGRISDEMDAGANVVQCYLDVSNPDLSLMTEASALSYWAGNRMVQLARENLRWCPDLGGTGMALSKPALEAAGGFGESLTEDQDLGVRLLLAGHRVTWAHDVRVRDEKPRGVAVAMRQRARWMAGKRGVRRAHLRDLLEKPTPARLDMALRLVQPGRSFVALISGVLAVTAVVTSSPLLLPWQLWTVVASVQVLQPIPFLAKEGVGWRRLLRYPLLAVLAALWIPIRLASRAVDAWYHTPHEGVSPESKKGLAPDR